MKLWKCFLCFHRKWLNFERILKQLFGFVSWWTFIKLKIVFCQLKASLFKFVSNVASSGHWRLQSHPLGFCAHESLAAQLVLLRTVAEAYWKWVCIYSLMCRFTLNTNESSCKEKHWIQPVSGREMRWNRPYSFCEWEGGRGN